MSCVYHRLPERRAGGRWNWWGGGRCKDLNLAVGDGPVNYYNVCLGDFGKPGGKPADVIPGTCSNSRGTRAEHGPLNTVP